MTVEYGYVAYIDEAGDDGLRAVKPRTVPGSSEWLILSATVIRATNQAHTKDWIENLRGRLRVRQAKTIHFHKLRADKKLLACEYLAKLPARYFIVASNKKNIEGYTNPDASKIPSQCWFYCWMTRVLLERVTHYVAARSLVDFGESKFLRLEYSERGGLRYSQMHAYYEWLKMKRSRPFLPWGQIDWSVMHRDLFFVYPHWDREGLQLADVVASAFFKSCDKHDTGSCDPTFAKALLPRMAKDRSRSQISGYGVKLLPSLSKASLDQDQQAIFRFYGYPEQWWDPAAFSK
ncbi:DUF3800 domain-containing protein [Jiella pacifica]|uniref:DUF3800 domain-containing protein n=1 Tax=Jiella pacifica TaxID=2696469 RepID=A0A6N9T3V6_9HYPH|nr:DUF3800 domain-containing protein [Jiella pacifica]NDW04736.1 DUF3800 domain-containing protein [Jiella pacifica]